MLTIHKLIITCMLLETNMHFAQELLASIHDVTHELYHKYYAIAMYVVTEVLVTVVTWHKDMSDLSEM